jgi:hypothetical protein
MIDGSLVTAAGCEQGISGSQRGWWVIWSPGRSGQGAMEGFKIVMMSAIGNSIVHFQVFVASK